MTGQDTAADLHRIDAEPFWTAAVMPGAHGWHPVPSWGRGGWDLGGWPLVVIYQRHTAEGWQLAYDVEGDVSARRQHEGREWVEGVEDAEAASEHLRGAFSWTRPGGLAA